MEISWDIYIYKNIPIAKQGEKEDLQNKTDMIFSWLLVLVGTYVIKELSHVQMSWRLEMNFCQLGWWYKNIL